MYSLLCSLCVIQCSLLILSVYFNNFSLVSYFGLGLLIGSLVVLLCHTKTKRNKYLTWACIANARTATEISSIIACDCRILEGEAWITQLYVQTIFSRMFFESIFGESTLLFRWRNFLDACKKAIKNNLIQEKYNCLAASRTRKLRI